MKIEWIDEGYELVKMGNISVGTAFALPEGGDNILIKIPCINDAKGGKSNCVNVAFGGLNFVASRAYVYEVDAKIVAKKNPGKMLGDK